MFGFSFDCLPESWMLFQDPKPEDRDKQLKLFIERCDNLVNKEPFPTAYEMHPGRLLWYLYKAEDNLESAYAKWLKWVEWRHALKLHEITKEEIADELETNVAFWKGKDKMNRPCCVVTGRNHDVMGRKGNYKTFKKFMVYMVEQGIGEADQNLYAAHCKHTEELKNKRNTRPKRKQPANEVKVPTELPKPPVANNQMDGLLYPNNTASSSVTIAASADSNSTIGVSSDTSSAVSSNATAVESNAEEKDGEEVAELDIALKHGQICILYDRRGLDDQHIDSQLYAVCNALFTELQYHYGDRMGMFYVLHVNWVFWLGYQYIVKPFLEFTGKTMVKIVNNKDELTGEFFEEGEMHFLEYVENTSEGVNSGSSLASIDPNSNTGLMLSTLQSNAQSSQEGNVVKPSEAIDR